MATAQDALNLARSKLNYGEGPRNNETMFGAWAGMNFEPWCDMFVSWVLDQIGLGIGKQTYCPSTVVYWRALQRLYTSPQVGDQAIYFWNGQYAHTGLVESVDGGYINAIEGNTNDAGSAEGGAVLRKRRQWQGTRTVFGRPRYSAEQHTVPATFKTYNPPIIFPPIVADWPVGDGLVLLGSEGSSYAFFGAPYPGKSPPIPAGVATHPSYQLEPVVDALAADGPGGWLLAASGAIYALGGAQYHGAVNGKDYFKGFIAWGMEATPDGRYKIFSTADPHGVGYGPDF